MTGRSIRIQFLGRRTTTTRIPRRPRGKSQSQLYQELQELQERGVNVSSKQQWAWQHKAFIRQQERYGDYLSAMQYSLLHLTGDYPILRYTLEAKLLLIVGLVIGTCAVAVWTAIFSSSMVNYLANEAIEDPLAQAVERRMLLAAEVVLKIQRRWRRRQEQRRKAREAGGPDAESLEPRRSVQSQDQASWFSKQRIVWAPLFQGTLILNLSVNMLLSLPEFRDQINNTVIGNVRVIGKGKVAETCFEAACILIFLIELIVAIRAGKGRDGKRWYFYRAVDILCLVPGIATIYSVYKEIHIPGADRFQNIGIVEQLQAQHDLLNALKMIRVLRVLFWYQWREDVQILVRGILSTGPIMAVPIFMSLQIWVVISSLFVFTENAWDGPSKVFFPSVPAGMYWTSSFLIGEWTLADFSGGAGSRVCIAVALFGIMGFAVPMGILMEGVRQSMLIDLMERLPLNELAEYEDHGKGKQQSSSGGQELQVEKSLSRMDGSHDRQQQLRRAAKVAAMTRIKLSKNATTSASAADAGQG
mmetsp:Transcript_25073/g.58122  ORF Transcript_25073/g.58122 Transcript_25073/m.58122 type:complete len:530 (+) Transcript_25073:559-2148(+)